MEKIEKLAEKIKTENLNPMSAYEIAIQIYSNKSSADLAAQETRRAGWEFAGYDWNGDEVYTP